jgi:hypothetical protein
MTEFNVYENVKLLLTFTDENGALADPSSAVKVALTSPSGVESLFELSDPEITKVSTGVYRFDDTEDEAGVWEAQGQGEGTYITSEKVTFRFYPSNSLLAPP